MNKAYAIMFALVLVACSASGVRFGDANRNTLLATSADLAAAAASMTGHVASATAPLATSASLAAAAAAGTQNVEAVVAPVGVVATQALAVANAALPKTATNDWETGSHSTLLPKTSTNGWETGSHAALVTTGQLATAIADIPVSTNSVTAQQAQAIAAAASSNAVAGVSLMGLTAQDNRATSLRVLVSTAGVDTNTIVVSGAGTAGANGTYVYSDTSGGYRYFYNSDGFRFDVPLTDAFFWLNYMGSAYYTGSSMQGPWEAVFGDEPMPSAAYSTNVASYVAVATSNDLVAAMSRITNSLPATLAGYVPTTRVLTIHGIPQDLSQNRTWTAPPTWYRVPIGDWSTSAGARPTMTRLAASSAFGYVMASNTTSSIFYQLSSQQHIGATGVIVRAIWGRTGAATGGVLLFRNTMQGYTNMLGSPLTSTVNLDAVPMAEVATATFTNIVANTTGVLAGLFIRLPGASGDTADAASLVALEYSPMMP